MAGHGHERFDARQHALGIVRQHHHIMVGQMPGQRGVHAIQGGRFGMLLEVHAQQLLLAAQHAHLQRGMQGRVGNQVGMDAGLGGQAANAVARLIFAQHAHQRHLAAQRRNVARYVGGATQAVFTARNAHHGHGRFRRDAFDFTEPVAVQHHVANH
ncbi:hypothetical protein D3C72_1430140 [compost metagenome]